VTVQVKVNLLLVGFNDEKDSPFSVNSDAFLGWFNHVEDSLRHTLLAAKGDGSVDTEKEPVFSKVVYDFKYQILQVSDIVNTVFEAAINTFMRPSSTPTLEYQVSSSPFFHFSFPQPPAYLFIYFWFLQVDIARFEPVLESFIHTIGLKDSYTLIVWKPKKFLKERIVSALLSFFFFFFFLSYFLSPPHVSLLSYGYRSGFSEMEMGVLVQNNIVSEVDEDSDHTETHDGKQPISLSFLFSFHLFSLILSSSPFPSSLFLREG